MELYDKIKEINEKSLTEEGTRKLIADLSENQFLSDAIAFGAVAHMFQVRKYLGVPYITHPIAVASIVKLVGGSHAQIVAAILHDTVEDVDGIELEDIADQFGEEIGELVEMLTDISVPEDGNRLARKTMDREHSAQASPEGQTCKLADLIHNTFSIVEHDPNFAKLYLEEKILLLDVLVRGDKRLHKMAKRIAADGLYTLKGAAKSASVFVEVAPD